MRNLIAIALLPLVGLAACAPPEASAPPVAAVPKPPPAAPPPAPAAPPAAMPGDLSPQGVAAADPYLWLEQVQGPRALAWVNEQNAAARARLEGDRRFEAFRAQAYDILSANDRIAKPHLREGLVYNFWQDKAHPKGVYRRTTLESYRSASPAWEAVLDVDALAKAEGKDWFWKGVECLPSRESRCLVNLSEGGKDAVEVREFDTKAKAFVAGGFRLPEGKHRLAWLGPNELLVATDFGPGTLTAAGYPYIVKRLKRGAPLAEAAEIYRGEARDGGAGVEPVVLSGPTGQVEVVLIRRPLDTFRSETWALVGGKPVKLSLPERIDVHGGLGGKIVFGIDEAWAPGWGGPYAAGSLLAVRVDVLAGRAPRPGADENPLVFSPGPRQSLNGVVVTRGRVVAAVYDNVRGQIVGFAPDGAKPWRQAKLPVPENVSASLVDAGRSSERVFYSYEGFLTPTTLMLGDAAAGKADAVRASPARFDASRLAVEQFEVASSDGANVPYFVVRPKDSKANGQAPTLMYGYGGFQLTKPPAYLPEMGKLWLENGGVFVNANIRGGGEFGPAWHQAAQRENRQKSFDDFAAVARDLAARGLTSPRRLGIYGRSNGGVLTSVSITQHPELFNAAVIESPLVDMLRYHELPAGASWIGEYGDPRVPGDAAFIARYSAYQNVKPGRGYPQVYVTTNTLDDRVHPGHARKFAARLKEYGYDPIYFEDTSGGHSYDADPAANARRWARHYVYLAQRLID
ncbi:MAG TPA: prolyl oligopeptidase family serine peptidase [Polyangiaceae bacterium]|nr:prolyl oligopeptidase family serine peptidase [Polyangiaceae bacterium]